MCTLVVVWDVFDEAPVVVAANRDEAVDRPSTPPVRREGHEEGSPAVVAPRDERAGGTWIGYNDAGVFVGLSNRWGGPELAGERSRGLLVDDALAEADAGSAVRAVEAALAADEYDGFNLVVADAGAAVLLEWDGRLSVTGFDQGVHVVMNAGYDDDFHAVPERPEAAAAQATSAARVRDALWPRPGETPDAWLDRAGDVLGDHDYGVCVHGDGFGTRSSSLVALRSDGSATYRFADGSPCETAYETVETAATGGDGPVEGQS